MRITEILTESSDICPQCGKNPCECEHVTEGVGNFAKAIGNLHGWYQEKSNNPDIEIYEFDDNEGGFYAQGTVYHNVKTGQVKIEFEDRSGYHGGDVNGTFNSIGDAMNVLRQITIPIRPNNGKAPNFDRLAGRDIAGPTGVYKSDRAGKKGTLTKDRMDTMKMSSPYRKTGPKGVLPEQDVAEGENWSKHNNPRAGGMSKKSVASYRRSHPGSKIQTAVTTKPSKLKKGSKSAKRRASFCARMKGMKKHRTSAKTARDPNSNINKSLRRWNCESIEQMQELVMLAEQLVAKAKKEKL